MSLKLVTRCVSTLWSLGRTDIANGLKIAALGAVSDTLIQWCITQHWPTSIEALHAVKAAGFASALFLIHKFTSGPKSTNTPK